MVQVWRGREDCLVLALCLWLILKGLTFSHSTSSPVIRQGAPSKVTLGRPEHSSMMIVEPPLRAMRTPGSLLTFAADRAP